MQKFNLILIITIFLLSSVTNIFASEKWSSTFLKDINGDGKSDIFIYTLQKKGANYEGSLTITNNVGKILWLHSWKMTKKDLEDDLLREQGSISVKEWVNHFFDGTLLYGAKLAFYKIKESEIDQKYIVFYAKKHAIEPQKLKSEILSLKQNTVFSYRASWREDFIMLVYVPSLSKFVGFSGGEY
jgi:hypothetical protein